MDEVILIIFVTWILFLVFLFWLVGFAEFSYFGNKGVKLLYNLFSPIYNFKWLSSKYQNKELNQRLFIEPLKEAFHDNPSGEFLDLACGSGRMSLMLLEQNFFEGRIEALDFSKGMLNQFSESLKKFGADKVERVKINFLDLADWQPQKKFQVVAFMEAGEFVPDFVKVISKISLSLTSGGRLLLTKPPDWMWIFYPGRNQRAVDLTKLLESQGFASIKISDWTSRYQVVSAIKK
jgi:trans-aconitate methyltransferase